jgi:biopolymer transport protein ExbD
MKIKNHNKIEPKMDMSSMTDIVFLLLIFFMMTSSFDNSSAISLTLPSSTTSDKVVSHIEVSITKDLKYYVGKTEVKDLSKLGLEVEKAMKVDSENNIHLYTDKEVPIGEITQMYILADKLKATVSLAVETP